MKLLRTAISAFGIFFVQASVSFSQEQSANLAVVTTRTIYPGQTISADALILVDASNCPNCDEGFVQQLNAITGMVAVKTLVPGKLIFPGSLRRASTVTPDQEVTVLLQTGGLQISMRGLPLEEAATGSSVSVRNRENGTVISGVVQVDGTVLVAP